jgi:hypothetical protein
MNPVESTPLVRSVAALLIVVAVAGSIGRILSVARVYEPNLFRAEGDQESPLGSWPKTRPEPMPTLGANDRSRWDTVRALVDEGTYCIGHRETEEGPDGKPVDRDRGIVTEDGWGTIDKILLNKHDFYSSKPPLLPTLVAGEYWLLRHGLGWSITKDRFWVVRTILLTFNALPFGVLLILLYRLFERHGVSDWGRLFLLATAAFGTFVSPFLVSLNNHTPATCCVLFALYPALTGPPSLGRAALSGFFAGLAAATELPAASFVAALMVLWVLRGSWKTLPGFLVAASLPIVALLVTNHLAIGQWSPAYGEFGGEQYEFKGSHWVRDPSKRLQGIDWAGEKESSAIYAFHLVLGHHGLFALTPVFVLGLAGVGWARNRAGLEGPAGVAIFTLAITVVVVGFYVLIVGPRSHNYGGWTAGPRWLMWLTPLFLVGAIPTADALSRRRLGRALGLALLAVSVFSASYPTWNPWRHPWLYNLLTEYRLIQY